MCVYIRENKMYRMERKEANNGCVMRDKGTYCCGSRGRKCMNKHERM
jgi:hypothetical protein